jgi:hypothetical protein
MKKYGVLCGPAVIAIVLYFASMRPVDADPVPATANPDTVLSISGSALLTRPFAQPIARFTERVTKKPFGRHITPHDSPIQPEKFSGYHTGTDFEIFENEGDSDVPVFSITDGVIMERRMATGYGGVVVTSGVIEGKPVTVVYGHVRLLSVRTQIGDSVHAGDTLAVLGKGYSTETDGERKHLHLSIHRGTIVNIRGYVHSQAELENWIDPMGVLSRQ